MADNGLRRSPFAALVTFFRRRAVVVARLVGLSLLFVSARVGIEHLFFHRFLGVAEQDLSLMTRFYGPLTKTLGGRRKPQHCTIVRIESPSSPQLQADDCTVRGKLAQVLEIVLSYQPRAVVADYTLRKLECCANTARLIEAAQRACIGSASENPSPVPIVFGFDLGPGPRVLAHTSITPSGSQSSCGMGVTNPELDLRIVPMQFKVDGYPVPSLAWTVAQMVDHRLNAELATQVNASSPLYTILLDNDDFREYTMTDDELLSRKFLPEMLRGHVVVIGSSDDQVVPTAFGPLQGHVLHAGYIEALLDRHTLRKMSEWITFFVAIVFWYLVESRPFLAAIKMLLIETIVLLLVNLFFLRVFSLYGDFSTISIAGLFVWLFTVIREIPQVQKWINEHSRVVRPSDWRCR